MSEMLHAKYIELTNKHLELSVTYAELADKYLESKSEITKLKRANEIMKTALEFYAEWENWNGFKIEDDHDLHKDGFYTGGKRARQALSEVEGMK